MNVICIAIVKLGSVQLWCESPLYCELFRYSFFSCLSLVVKDPALCSFRCRKVRSNVKSVFRENVGREGELCSANDCVTFLVKMYRWLI